MEFENLITVHARSSAPVHPRVLSIVEPKDSCVLSREKFILNLLVSFRLAIQRREEVVTERSLPEPGTVITEGMKRDLFTRFA
jgi:hypothetical protein